MKKILLLHGWNYNNYTKMTQETDAWHNRQKLVNLLANNYEIYKLNFPGFCGEREPNRAWSLEDYAKYVKNYIQDKNVEFDYILGYSFGGAVAVMYNRLFNHTQKLILISPAIVRNKDKSKKFIKTPKIFQPLRNSLRNFYLTKIVKNKEMVYGTKFLQESYQLIVRVELIDYIKEIAPGDLTIIYGDADTMVNPNLVVHSLPAKYEKSIHMIKGGGHDIANTHYKEIMTILKDIS